MKSDQQWGSRSGFLLAAVGSVIGIGNIWRFPAVAYENGGGAFFIPYMFALVTVGIPMLILEFAIGQKYNRSAPFSFASMHYKAEWIGWWQVGIAFVISTYYAVIIAWALSYSIFSINQSWGMNTESYLFEKYLQLSDNIGQVGSIVPNVFISLVIVWMIVAGILIKGIKKGIEIANKICLPLLLILFTIFVVRTMLLPGAAVGLHAFFEMNWEKLLEGSVWFAAYGQVFFSLSIGFAIMMTYTSYLPKNGEVTKSAFMIGFANTGFEILSGIAVFSLFGFIAVQQGLDIQNVVAEGIGLAFIVIPTIINEFPTFSGFFGFLFFSSLFIAGLTSLMSIVETYVAAIQDKFKVKRTIAVLVGVVLSAFFSIFYSTQGGLRFLDIVETFINSYGVVLAGLMEVVVVAWITRNLNDLKNYVNDLSNIRLDSWWNFCLTFVTPIALGLIIVNSMVMDMTDPYGGYPIKFLIIYGWGTAATVLVAGVLLSKRKWNDGKLESSGKEGHK